MPVDAQGIIEIFRNFFNVKLLREGDFLSIEERVVTRTRLGTGTCLGWRIVDRSLAFGYDVFEHIANCGDMRHPEVSVDLNESTMFMPELAPLAVLTVFLTVESTTVLRLKYFVGLELFFCQFVDLCELVEAVGELATDSISTEPGLGPILANIALVLPVTIDVGDEIFSLHGLDRYSKLRGCHLQG